jgi:NADP-dependent 3-hydroxy acid dehydrogenase YdfG
MRADEGGKRMSMQGSVVVVAGAGGGAGAAVVHRLATAGATVVMSDRELASLEPLVAEVAAAGGVAHPYAVDLTDDAATTEWAASIVSTFGRVDGLVHLVGGWRGGKGITEADLADWDWLQNLLIRTVQHTSRGFHDALRASSGARFVLVSAAEASRPTAKNASYAAAKAAAEAWTLALADSFRDSAAAATIVVVKALVTPQMRAAKPDSEFNGYTDVADLANAIVKLWDEPADVVNGERIWLTP